MLEINRYNTRNTRRRERAQAIAFTLIFIVSVMMVCFI